MRELAQQLEKPKSHLGQQVPFTDCLTFCFPALPCGLRPHQVRQLTASWLVGAGALCRQRQDLHALAVLCTWVHLAANVTMQLCREVVNIKVSWEKLPLCMCGREVLIASLADCRVILWLLITSLSLMLRHIKMKQLPQLDCNNWKLPTEECSNETSGFACSFFFLNVPSGYMQSELTHPTFWRWTWTALCE